MIAPGRVSPVTSSSSSSRLVRGNHAGDSKAAEAIRDLVETVTVFREPSRPGGVMVEIARCLNALRGERAYPNEVLGPARGRYRPRGSTDTELAGRRGEHRPHIPVNDKSNERMAPSWAAPFEMFRQTTPPTVPRGRP